MSDFEEWLWHYLLGSHRENRETQVKAVQAVFLQLAKDYPTIMHNLLRDNADGEVLAPFRKHKTRSPWSIEDIIDSSDTWAHRILYHIWRNQSLALKSPTKSSAETITLADTSEPKCELQRREPSQSQSQSLHRSSFQGPTPLETPHPSRPFRPGFHIPEDLGIQVYRRPSRNIIAQIYPVQLLQDVRELPVGQPILPEFIMYEKWTDILDNVCGFRRKQEAVYVAHEDGVQKFKLPIDNALGLQALLLTPPAASIQVAIAPLNDDDLNDDDLNDDDC